MSFEVEIVMGRVFERRRESLVWSATPFSGTGRSAFLLFDGLNECAINGTV
jgi:hypothetical protein